MHPEIFTRCRLAQNSRVTPAKRLAHALFLHSPRVAREVTEYFRNAVAVKRNLKLPGQRKLIENGHLVREAMTKIFLKINSNDFNSFKIMYHCVQYVKITQILKKMFGLRPNFLLFGEGF